MRLGFFRLMNDMTTQMQEAQRRIPKTKKILDATRVKKIPADKHSRLFATAAIEAR